MKSIKILHVFGKMNSGGAEVRTLEVMPLLNSKGVKFDFCTLAEGKGHLDDRIRELGGEVFSCSLRPGLLSFGRRFRKVLLEGEYDIVHSHVFLFSGKILQLAHKAGIQKRIAHFGVCGVNPDGAIAAAAQGERNRGYTLRFSGGADSHISETLFRCREHRGIVFLRGRCRTREIHRKSQSITLI